jgi:glycosyltransferase involved in cell wall biosynthesis
MRIGINALFWIPDAMGGTQTYFLNLLRALVRIDPANEYLAFLNKNGAQNSRIASTNLQVQICPIPGRMRSLRLLWESLLLPSYARRLQIDLLHSLGYIAPFALSIPSVITVMDMIHYIYPYEIEKSKRILWKVLFPASLRRAKHAISISKSVKRDIVRFFPWAESKTTPISLGVDHTLFNPSLPGENFSFENDKVRQFILAVASISPHKNIGTLIRAFAQVQRMWPDLRLALVGMKTCHAKALEQLVHNLSLDAQVHFLGRISDMELAKLYRRARVLVFPSLYEGFGLPLLEAMACGCPVIASNRSSMPEVCEDAALLFDPDDVIQLTQVIVEVLSSEELRTELQRRGLEHAAKYTWETTATKTLEVYHRCYEGTK